MAGCTLCVLVPSYPYSYQYIFSFDMDFIGLANRLVSHGEALSEAKLLARQLLSHPQLCLRQDRRSTYYSAYFGSTQENCLRNEFEEAVNVIEKESVQGAQRFSSGEGRGGTFSA